ncbi:MAG: hypothetical protein JO227_06400 [Acetobacteraceae bacterium]|nr:hypothetical protein [Acetobacteraceae bacterium]
MTKRRIFAARLRNPSALKTPDAVTSKVVSPIAVARNPDGLFDAFWIAI